MFDNFLLFVVAHIVCGHVFCYDFVMSLFVSFLLDVFSATKEK